MALKFLSRFKSQKEKEVSQSKGSVVGVEVEKDAVKIKKAVKEKKSQDSEKHIKSFVLKKQGAKGVIQVELSRILIHPIMTEKTAELGTKNRYVFRVQPKATRVAISQAFKAQYGVVPVRVNVMNVAGKRVRFGRRHGKKINWKKAIITVPKDKKVQVFEGV